MVGVLDVHVDKVIEPEVRENPRLENLLRYGAPCILLGVCESSYTEALKIPTLS